MLTSAWSCGISARRIEDRPALLGTGLETSPQQGRAILDPRPLFRLQLPCRAGTMIPVACDTPRHTSTERHMGRRLFLMGTVLVCALAAARVEDKKDNVPPEGFRALFNGKDLAGWQ